MKIILEEGSMSIEQKNTDIESLIASIQQQDITCLSDYQRVQLFNAITTLAAAIAPFQHPVLNVKLVSSSLVKDNDYNPNSVAPPEFRLLRFSIEKDGMTMPVVVAKEPNKDTYTIIDGYHRSKLIKTNLDIKSSLGGYIPVVILDKSIDDRMSSSIRHNMARGSHQVELTAQLIMKLRSMDWDNDQIGKELGMDSDEVLRMQQITGLAEAFKDQKFSSAWE